MAEPIARRRALYKLDNLNGQCQEVVFLIAFLITELAN